MDHHSTLITRLDQLAADAAREILPACADPPTDRQKLMALGMLIAKWLRWTADDILFLAAHLLEQANLHTEAEKLRCLLDMDSPDQGRPTNAPQPSNAAEHPFPRLPSNLAGFHN